jgi:orotate phosphoribosyltransferase-like protein
MLVSRIKVTKEMKRRIVELRRGGMKQGEIAVVMRLSQGTVSIVLREMGMGGKLMRLKA